MLGHLIDKVDALVIGGGMANTFLHALGTDVGASLCEADLKHTIQASTQFIEPILISCLGVIIGGIAIAVLMPIFQLSLIHISEPTRPY